MLETISSAVRRVVRSLNRTGLPYMFTGAIASTYYGRPRTTADIDIVVAVGRSGFVRLVEALREAGLKVDEKKLRKAWKSDYRIIALEDKKSPYSVDIIFAEGKLSRISGKFSGLHTFYESAESLILAKLRMLKVTIQPDRAATDRQDIKQILEFVKVDWKSLRTKARAQNTLKILDDIMKSLSAG